MPSASYGRGMVGLGRLECRGKLTRGLDTMIRDVYHALITERGSLPADPEAGLGLLSMIFADVDTSRLPAIAADIESELAKDERIATSEAAVSVDKEGRIVIDDLTVKLAAGPSFRLVGPISAVRAELTSNG